MISLMNDITQVKECPVCGCEKTIELLPLGQSWEDGRRKFSCGYSITIRNGLCVKSESCKENKVK